MRVHLSGHHVDVTPALRSYVEKKLSRVTRRFDHLIEVHCILTVEKLRHKAESTVFVRGSTIYADAVDGRHVRRHRRTRRQAAAAACASTRNASATTARPTRRSTGSPSAH